MLRWCGENIRGRPQITFGLSRFKFAQSAFLSHYCDDDDANGIDDDDYNGDDDDENGGELYSNVQIPTGPIQLKFAPNPRAI